MLYININNIFRSNDGVSQPEPNMRFCTTYVWWNYSLRDELNVQVAAVNVNVRAYCNGETQRTAAAIPMQGVVWESQPCWTTHRPQRRIGVTWRHWPRNHLIPIGHFLFMVLLWNQGSISNGFRDVQWRIWRNGSRDQNKGQGTNRLLI